MKIRIPWLGILWGRNSLRVPLFFLLTSFFLATTCKNPSSLKLLRFSFYCWQISIWKSYVSIDSLRERFSTKSLPSWPGLCKPSGELICYICSASTSLLPSALGSSGSDLLLHLQLWYYVKIWMPEFLLQQLIMFLLFVNYWTKLFIVSYSKHRN